MRINMHKRAYNRRVAATRRRGRLGRLGRGNRAKTGLTNGTPGRSVLLVFNETSAIKSGRLWLYLAARPATIIAASRRCAARYGAAATVPLYGWKRNERQRREMIKFRAACHAEIKVVRLVVRFVKLWGVSLLLLIFPGNTSTEARQHGFPGLSPTVRTTRHDRSRDATVPR